MTKAKTQILLSTLLVVGINLGTTTPVMAYSCNASAAEASKLIEEADSLMKADSDSRIKALIARAKGMLEASKVSHGAANQKHHGERGKYMHGDAVRQARQASAMAKEAIFLLSGQPR